MTDLETPRKLPTIGEEAKFYGYIVGLSVGLCDAGTEQLDRHPYVMFEYNDQRNVWIVPDDNLFGILSRYLVKTAWERKNIDGCGHNKVWIEKRNGRWEVSLP
jgi:hypothetical protein